MFEERLCAAAKHVSSLGYAPIYVSLHGSQNYGLSVYTDAYQSDYDFKCIVLPSLWDLVEGRKPASLTVDTQDGQIDIKDIRVFCDALERMNPAYLESLATENRLILEPRMNEICALLPALMKERASRFAQACEGLFEDKGKKMCHDSPAAHEKIVRFGYDGKQTHHMYRLLVQLRDFERRGVFCLEAPKQERELLIRLKLNEIPLELAQEMIEGWRIEIQGLRRRIEQEYGSPKSEAHRAIVRISREMMYAHCLKA